MSKELSPWAWHGTLMDLYNVSDPDQKARIHDYIQQLTAGRTRLSKHMLPHERLDTIAWIRRELT